MENIARFFLKNTIWHYTVWMYGFPSLCPQAPGNFTPVKVRKVAICEMKLKFELFQFSIDHNSCHWRQTVKNIKDLNSNDNVSMIIVTFDTVNSFKVQTQKRGQLKSTQRLWESTMVLNDSSHPKGNVTQNYKRYIYFFFLFFTLTSMAIY